MQDKRDQNDAEGQKYQEISLREGAAVGEDGGQGEYGGEGDNTAHAGPADDEDLSRARRLLANVADAAAHEVGQPVAGKDPDESKNDEYDAEDDPVGDHLDAAQVMN